MLGEGMPWHIIMFFFILAIVIGAVNAKNQAIKMSNKNNQQS